MLIELWLKNINIRIILNRWHNVKKIIKIILKTKNNCLFRRIIYVNVTVSKEPREYKIKLKNTDYTFWKKNLTNK